MYISDGPGFAFLEGNEKIMVDGERFPSNIRTGTEVISNSGWVSARERLPLRAMDFWSRTNPRVGFLPVVWQGTP